MTQPSVTDTEAGRERLSPIVLPETAKWLRVESAVSDERLTQGQIIDALVAAEIARRAEKAA